MRATKAGVDTWSVGWYVEADSIGHQAISALATQPAPRSRLIPQSIDGYRVGWFPGTGLVFAEGHPEPGGLCPPYRLPAAFDRLVGQLQDLGVYFTPGRAPRVAPKGHAVVHGGMAGVRRLDLTVDLAFERGSEGLAALTGVAALPFPRIQTGIRREPGSSRVQTVMLYGSAGRRMLGRWYDKGVESRSAAPGELIRPEDQRRFSRGSRLSPEAFRPEVVRSLFQKRFQPLWKATEGVTVGSVMRLAQKIADLRDRGELTARQAESLAGHLVLDAAGADANTRRTMMRRRSQARRYGLVLADGTTDEVEVDVHEVLEAALEADDWYREG